MSRRCSVRFATFLPVAAWFCFAGVTHAAAPSPAVAKAKKEGAVRVLASSSPAALAPMVKGFKDKYPFIDARATEIVREDSQTRAMQLKSGSRLDEDVIHVPPDLYPDYLPYLKKFDIAAMAEHKVLDIPVKMIDSIQLNLVAMESSLQVVAFNKCLIDPA